MTEYFTLQDFLTHTKIVSYLLAACFLIGAVFFWRFLNANGELPKPEEKAPGPATTPESGKTDDGKK